MKKKTQRKLTLTREVLRKSAGAVIHRTTFRCHESLYCDKSEQTCGCTDAVTYCDTWCETICHTACVLCVYTPDGPC